MKNVNKLKDMKKASKSNLKGDCQGLQEALKMYLKMYLKMTQFAVLSKDLQQSMIQIPAIFVPTEHTFSEAGHILKKR